VKARRLLSEAVLLRLAGLEDQLSSVKVKEHQDTSLAVNSMAELRLLLVTILVSLCWLEIWLR